MKAKLAWKKGNKYPVPVTPDFQSHRGRWYWKMTDTSKGHRPRTQTRLNLRPSHGTTECSSLTLPVHQQDSCIKTGEFN